MSKGSLLHYRRCHVCNTVNESEGGFVEKCLSCDKPLCRFYYFDDSEAPIYSDLEPSNADPSFALATETARALALGRSSKEGDGSTQPKRTLKGFTALW